jgi:hypothetical protein
MPNETVIPLADGKLLCCPAHPAPCEYVRIANSEGTELAYWSHAEWKAAPQEMMGALCGALAAPEGVAKSSDASPRRPGLTAESAYDAIAKLARAHGIILEGAGGVLTVVHPDTLRRNGLYCRTRWMAGLGPNPGHDQDPNAYCTCKRPNREGRCPPGSEQACPAQEG